MKPAHSPADIRLLEPVSPSEAEVFGRLRLDALPRHVAIIMDGNGRWARRRSLLERIEGHRAGIDGVRASVRTAAQLRLNALTLYAFSTENWSRPRHEIRALMELLDRFLVDEIPELQENNIRLVASGQIADLPDRSQRLLAETMRVTESNTGLVLNLALSYGGRQELVTATQRIAERVRAGEINPADIDQNLFAQHLYHPELGDPELLVRTSGEQRVSNFLLWQIAYAEFVYLDVLWPDFRREHFLRAVEIFQGRDRRFGGVDPVK